MVLLPAPDADEIEWVAFEQAGVFATDQVVRLAGRDFLRGHLTAGRWRKVCRGIHVNHNGPLSREQQLWVASLAAGPGAALAGITALEAGGVRGIRAGPLYVLIPIERNRSLRLPTMPPDMPPVRVVRTRFLPAEHLQNGRPPRTTVARAAVDAAVWASGMDEAITLLASSCQQGRVTAQEIFEVLAVRRGLPRLRLIRATMQDIAGGAQALSEINLVRLCRRFALPVPDRQVRRRDANGRWRYLDAYWSGWNLHVEIDGAHHMEVGQWMDDMARQNDVWISGDRILRFPARMLRLRPAQVAAQLQAALEAAGWKR